MLNSRTISLLTISFATASCGSGPLPRISLDHFSDTRELGTTVSPPQFGGSGPPLFVRAFDPATDELTFPQRLPELIEFYRSRLIANAHHLDPNGAEKFSKLTIEQLERKYSGDKIAFRAELLRRLQPVRQNPGKAVDAYNNIPVFRREEGAQ